MIRTTLFSSRLLPQTLVLRGVRHASVQPSAAQTADGGSIMDAFASTSTGAAVLPQRFSDLKKQLWHPSLETRWKEVLAVLEVETKRIVIERDGGKEMIPRLPFGQIQAGKIDPELAERIFKTGSVIIEGAVSEQEALKWKADILEYARVNKEHVRGFPAEEIQVFEFYNSKSQTSARTHPNVVATQRWLLNFLPTSNKAEAKVSLRTVISYYDRLRIRTPGDAKFALGPHIDGGSLERWEDPSYRSCFADILSANSKGWKEHNPYDITPRIDADMDMYKIGKGACGVLRPWQGWTSLSDTGPGEGTLRVFPNVRLANAYVMLRPFFSPKPNAGGSLKAEDWAVDLESTAFPGSAPGLGLELTDASHPHLRLEDTMTSMPRVKPGDQVYWFSDVIHAVEKIHNGTGDSSVLYIPAIPLTEQNAAHLRKQAKNFAAGLPSPDFPQGQGESLNVGRSTPASVVSLEARRVLGLEKFEIPAGAEKGEREVLESWNAKFQKV